MKTPDPRAFRSGRHFAAWARPHAQGPFHAGKTRLGKITRAGDEDLSPPAGDRGDRGDPAGQASPRHHSHWLLALIQRKPPKLAAVALANKVARILEADGHRGDVRRDADQCHGGSRRRLNRLAGRRLVRRPTRKLQEQMERSIEQRCETSVDPLAAKQSPGCLELASRKHLGQRSTIALIAGHMDATDPTHSKSSCATGPSTYGSLRSAGTTA